MFDKILLVALSVVSAQGGLLPLAATPGSLAPTFIAPFGVPFGAPLGARLGTSVVAPVGTAGVVAPYASSFNAHRINHAVAAPAPVALSGPAPFTIVAPVPPKLTFATPALGPVPTPFGVAGPVSAPVPASLAFGAPSIQKIGYNPHTYFF